jgi:hypothetical protein
MNQSQTYSSVKRHVKLPHKSAKRKKLFMWLIGAFIVSPLETIKKRKKSRAQGGALLMVAKLKVFSFAINTSALFCVSRSCLLKNSSFFASLIAFLAQQSSDISPTRVHQYQFRTFRDIEQRANTMKAPKRGHGRLPIGFLWHATAVMKTIISCCVPVHLDVLSK